MVLVKYFDQNIKVGMNKSTIYSNQYSYCFIPVERAFLKCRLTFEFFKVIFKNKVFNNMNM